MAELSVPNTFVNDTLGDALDVNANFEEIETFVNGEVVHRDGSVAMTGDLVLAGSPETASSAANRAYVDQAEADAVAAAAAAAAAADAAVAAAKADAVHTHDYSKLRLTNPVRVLDEAGGRTAGVTYGYQFSGTIGGVDSAGAVGALVTLGVSGTTAGGGYVETRPYGGSYGTTAALVFNQNDDQSGLALVKFDAFTRFEYRVMNSNVGRFTIDVFGFVY